MQQNTSAQKVGEPSGVVHAGRAFAERYGAHLDQVGADGYQIDDADFSVRDDAELAERMLAEKVVELISFELSGKLFALPVMVVQEVIQATPPAKLPTAPGFVLGVINLRGKVTPLIRIRDLLGLNSEGRSRDRFVVICRHRGLQIGLMIESVAAMRRVKSQELDFNVKRQLGRNAAHLLALLRLDREVVSILSVDRLTEGVLEEEGGRNG